MYNERFSGIEYLGNTLEHASMQDDLKPFQTSMRQRLDATLEEYVSALQ